MSGYGWEVGGCGLALDKPTTNLDHENVEGLAQALADIIR